MRPRAHPVIGYALKPALLRRRAETHENRTKRKKPPAMMLVPLVEVSQNRGESIQSEDEPSHPVVPVVTIDIIVVIAVIAVYNQSESVPTNK